MTRYCRPYPVAARRRRGVGLLEAALLLLIFGLLVWLSLDLLRRFDHRRRCHIFVADLRAFAQIIERHGLAGGDVLPSAAGPAALPPEVESALQATNWQRGSPFGGSYEWIPAPQPVAADQSGPRRLRVAGAIAVTAFAPAAALTASRRDLLQVDAALDDGNLMSGRFRTGFNGWPIYSLGDP